MRLPDVKGGAKDRPTTKEEWKRRPDKTDARRKVAAQKKLRNGFDCRANFGIRRDATDRRAIEARDEARYEGIARRKEREERQRVRPPREKRLRPLLRGCRPDRVRLAQRKIVNFPKKRGVFPPLRSDWADYDPAHMPTRYNEQPGAHEARITPMSLMPKQIWREEAERAEQASPANSSQGSPAKGSSRGSPAKSQQGSPAKRGTGSIYDVLAEREPVADGEVLEATLPDGRRVRVRVPPGALVEPARTPPPRPLLARDADGGPLMPSLDDARIPPRPVIAAADRRSRDDSPPPQPLSSPWQQQREVDHGRSRAVAHNHRFDAKVADNAPARPRRPPTPGAPRQASPARRPGAVSPTPSMAAWPPDAARRPASPSPADFVAAWDFAAPATPRQAAADSPPRRARFGAGPSFPGASPPRAADVSPPRRPAALGARGGIPKPRRPCPPPPLVWKNDRPRRSKSRMRRTRRLEALPGLLRSQASKF